MTSATVCVHCGAAETGRINGLSFCNKEACVSAVMAAELLAAAEEVRLDHELVSGSPEYGYGECRGHPERIERLVAAMARVRGLVEPR